MDIYALNSGYSRIDLVEDYVSFIWTERYDKAGDFELQFYPNNTKLNGLISIDRLLSHSDTNVPMIVETMATSEDQNGYPTVKATGRSLEAPMLESRATAKSSTKTGSTGELVQSMIQLACVPGLAITDADAYPGFSVVNAAGTNSDYTIDYTSTDIYSLSLTLLAGTNTGYTFSMTSDNKLVYRIFNGARRPNVTFSKRLDSLSSSSFVRSKLKYRNVAYVRTTKGTYVVYAPKTSSSVSGFARRAMPVDATDIDSTKYTTAAFEAAAKKRGLNALANQVVTNLIDGEISFDNEYKFKKHYFLGDIVAFEGDYGGRQSVRVTEYIWSNDSSGTRAYPTLVDIDSET